MKILIISNYANGLILFRKEVISSFIERGDNVIISVPNDENANKLTSLGAKVIPSHLERRGMNPIKDLKLLLEYLNLLKKEKPDIVLTYTIKPNLYGGMACALCKIPYLMNITGLGTALENPGLLGKILLKFYKIVTKKAVCVFFQNEGNRNFMLERGIAQNNSSLLPGSGVNLTEHPYEPYPTEENGICILAVLRIMKDKGIEEYFEAAKYISTKYPSVSFELVGEYEEDIRQKYEPIIQDLEKKNILKYYGHIDNVPEVMAQNHIIIHPSYHEGLSNVCLEAAACGRPVLTTDIPGCRETIITQPQGSISGILFPAKDSSALVTAIESILSLTSTEREQLGKNGRHYVEQNFSRQIVVNTYMTATDSILGKQKKSDLSE